MISSREKIRFGCCIRNSRSRNSVGPASATPVWNGQLAPEADQDDGASRDGGLLDAGPVRADRSLLAGIRNPSPKQPFGLLFWNGSCCPKADLQGPRMAHHCTSR